MRKPTLGLILSLAVSAFLVGCPPPSRNVVVPNVAGLTQTAASSALVAAQLVVGSVTTQPSQTVPAGCVISQSPAAGARVAPNSAVSLVVSTGPAPSEAWHYTPGDDAVWGLSIRPTSDNGFIIGGGLSWYNMHALKLSATGAWMWDETYSNIEPGPNQSELWRFEARGIQETADGGYIMVGRGNMYQDMLPTPSYLLVKLDSLGEVDWARSYAPDNPYDPGRPCGGNNPRALQITDDGGYVAFGDSYVGAYQLASILKTDAAGDVEFLKVINDNGRAYDQHIQAGLQTADGGYVLAGYSSNGAPEGYLALLIKLDSAGNLEWSGKYNYPPDDHGAEAYCVTQTANGDYLIGGELINDINNNKVLTHGCWIARINADGEEVWAQSHGHGYTVHYPMAMQETPQGDFVATGDFNGHPILAKFDALGNLIWNFVMDDYPGMGKALTLTPDGGCVVVCSAQSGNTTIVKIDHVFVPVP